VSTIQPDLFLKIFAAIFFYFPFLLFPFFIARHSAFSAVAVDIQFSPNVDLNFFFFLVNLFYIF